MRRLASLLVCIACGRDLTLPPQAQPPRIDSVSPAEGFAGDMITITGANLADPAAQVFFDVRAAVILTPTDQRDGKSLLVEVPQNVLGATVSVTTGQGTGKASQDFTYLGLGHPRTVALRATLSLAPNVQNVVPLPGGDISAVLDQRFGSVRGMDAQGGLTMPARVGEKPIDAFGPASSCWVVDDAITGPPMLHQMDLTQDPPVPGLRVEVDAELAWGGGSPSGARYAVPSGAQVMLYELPDGGVFPVDIPGATIVYLARFWGDDVIVGLSDAAPFRIDLGGGARVVTMGAAWPNPLATPDVDPMMAVDDPARGQLAYTAHQTIRLLTWSGAAAPALSPTVIQPRMNPGLLAFNQDGTRVMAADVFGGIVGECDPSTGALLSAQPLPGIASLAVTPSGTNQGFLAAATGDGTALLFPDGRLLRRAGTSVGATGLAVDPVCSDVLVASDYGALRIEHQTLTPSVLSPLHLDGIRASEGGVVGFTGNDIWAYLPAPNCAGAGGFALVATSPDTVVDAALSADGKWVAAAGFQTVDLLPRADGGAGGTAQRKDFGTQSNVEVAFAGNQLTVLHAAQTGFAVSSYQPGTLTESGSLAFADPPRGLRRVRFAQAWMINQNVFDGALNFIGTHVTVWSAAGGTLAESDVPASVTVPSGVSADGFMLVGISRVGTQSGLDTLLLEVDQNRLLQISGPHVDLTGEPTAVFPSPDGGRFYALLPGISSVAVVE